MPLNRKFEITDAKGGAAFTVRVVTRSETSELVGIQEDGMLKVRLKAPSAGDQAANEELVSLLAAELGVGANKIEIVAGAGARDKLVSVEGISTADVEARFGSASGE